jgi:hypothetical protein
MIGGHGETTTMQPAAYTPPDPGKMPEGEVILRLAFHLLTLPGALPTVRVGLDDKHEIANGEVIFPVADFLAAEGWQQKERKGKRAWQGTYRKGHWQLIISPDSRGGDVVATVGKKRVRAECKKGNLNRTTGNPENKLVHEAIGQLMTIEDYDPGDVLIVGVPLSPPHRSKVAWQNRPLMRKIGITLVLVGRNGTVEGMPSLA